MIGIAGLACSNRINRKQRSGLSLSFAMTNSSDRRQLSSVILSCARRKKCTFFWLEKCEHEARSCTCHSPQTVLATASIFAMLVLYQLLLKYTKCQYGELTVSLLFSAQREHETRPLCISIGGGAGQNEQRNHKETRIPSLQKVWPARLKQDLPLSVDLLTTSLKTTN